jgi:hypothetical protein
MRGLVVVAGAGAVALVVHSLIRKRQLGLRAARLAKHTEKLDLLPNERGPIICMAPPSSTVTFFRGSHASAQKYLSQRVTEIVLANPWLASILEFDESEKLAGMYSLPCQLVLLLMCCTRSLDCAVTRVPNTRGTAYYPDAATASRICRLEFRDDIVLSLARSTYAEIVHGLAAALCKTSEQSVGTAEPLWRVSIVPDADEPSERFSVVVSGNHSLLDGHDFYRLQSMLSSDSSVEALNPVRKKDIPSKILTAMGGEPSLLARSPPGFIMRFIGGQLWNALFPATRAIGFYVSEAWIMEQKKLAENRELLHSKESVRFVSTNDVLVSTFCKLLACDVALMAMNFRGRVSDCNAEDVGNYEDLLCYTPSDYASPALIRKSVSSEGAYEGAAQPRSQMPTNLEHLSGATYAAITNWSTFR